MRAGWGCPPCQRSGAVAAQAQPKSPRPPGRTCRRPWPRRRAEVTAGHRGPPAPPAAIGGLCVQRPCS
eukprot:13414372-Alexandrium_andersonii.AAC.1